MTPDVVESGPERPGRGLAVGVTAVLLLGAVAYGATRDRGTGPAGRAAPGATAAPGARRTAPDEPVGSPPVVRGRRGFGASLPPLRERTGLLVATAGPELAVVDVDSGAVTRTPMPSEEGTQPVAAIPGGWLVFVREFCRAAHCNDSLYAVRGGRATLLARGERAVPDPDGRSFWLTGYAYRTREPDENPPWLERRALDGRRLTSRVRLRPRERLVGVTARGPVTSYVGRRGQEITLLGRDGRDGAVLVRWGHPLAVSRDAIAYTTEECAGSGPAPCGLAVTRLDGATTEVAHLMSPVEDAAFDPSGRFLAVTLGHGHAPEPPDAGAPTVEVYDVVAGRLHDDAVPHPATVAALAWSPDGRHLVLAQQAVDARTFAARYRLVVWRPGEDAYAGPPFDSGGAPFIAVGSSQR